MFISPNTYENLKKNDSKINAADIVKTRIIILCTNYESFTRKKDTY